MGNINDTEANIERKSKEAQLLFAAENGHVDKLSALLSEKDVKVDCPNSSAVTALFLAAKEGHEECLRLLLEAGARVDGIGLGNTALSPLWVATYAGHKNCVERLVKAGANLNTKFPETPLFIAAREGKADCLKILIEVMLDKIQCIEVHVCRTPGKLNDFKLFKTLIKPYMNEWQGVAEGNQSFSPQVD